MKYKRRIGVHYKIFWRRTGLIYNLNSSQKPFLSQASPESTTCKGVRHSDGEIGGWLFRSLSKSNWKRTSFYGDCGESEELFHRKYRTHIRKCSNRLNLTMGTVWKVLWKDLNWKSSKPHKDHILSPANRLARKSAYEIWLTFKELWCERVIWTVGKWFVLRLPPHSQNDLY